jgi:ATP-dependent RNA helicase SUPV3L1/SUV3
MRSGGFAFSRKNPDELVLCLEGQGTAAAQLELQRLKKTLQDGTTPMGADSGYANLDPELQYFDTFEKKVIKCFEDGDGNIRGTASEGSSNLSLLQAFTSHGRIGLRKALLFAYVDHILDSRQTRGRSLSIPKSLDLRYPTEWYLSTRAMQREIHLHVGPTNSGKTYHALKRLEEAGNGIYAGPLRLLAHEVYSRFNNKGMPCDLVTGDDVRRANLEAEAPLSSYTVEMINCGKTVDVAVIDEIQMIANEERGWAWTRALLGTKAKELHLCGETRVVPLIRELAASMGDTLHIHHYDRLNPLKAMSKSLRGNLRELRRGDCIVSFSVIGIHAMKKQIEVETGRRVAIIYGSLPPEIRAQQAALFNDPNNDFDFLVASDAIGMGLNL